MRATRARLPPLGSARAAPTGRADRRCWGEQRAYRSIHCQNPATSSMRPRTSADRSDNLTSSSITQVRGVRLPFTAPSVWEARRAEVLALLAEQGLVHRSGDEQTAVDLDKRVLSSRCRQPGARSRPTTSSSSTRPRAARHGETDFTSDRLRSSQGIYMVEGNCSGRSVRLEGRGVVREVDCITTHAASPTRGDQPHTFEQIGRRGRARRGACVSRVVGFKRSVLHERNVVPESSICLNSRCTRRLTC